MPQIQTLSQTAIDGRKAETRNSQSLRKTVAIRDIQLINDTTIEYQGKRLEITKDAFKGLMKMIGMSQTFASKFEKLFIFWSKFMNTLIKTRPKFVRGNTCAR